MTERDATVKETLLTREMADLCDEVETLLSERFPGRAHDVLAACLLITGRQAGAHSKTSYKELEKHCLVLLREGWHFGKQSAKS